MNLICKLIWSAVHQQLVVVSELNYATRKSQSSRHAGSGGLAFKPKLLCAALAMGLATSHAQTLGAHALPLGGSVAAGTASLSSRDARLVIDQSSPRAVINWQSFNVGSDAQVIINNGSGSTLNRVLGPEASTILGRISATGQVVISNGNGVFFGPGSRLDVGSLLATTHQISNESFMAAGPLRFEGQGSTSSVVNDGEIRASLGGYIALLAPEVRNSGLILARKGTVVLAAGEAVTLQINSKDQLQGVVIEPGAWKALVDNRHVVEAEGGLVILSARALQNVQAGVVRHSGSIQTSSLTEVGGRVILTGDDIRLESGSSILATGATGGGQVLVGGDWQGGQNAQRRVFNDPSALYQASRVSMADGALIDASATQSGNGGTVVLWSEVGNSASLTTVQGMISARGGLHGGDGGQIETSGHRLAVNGARVDAGARAGRAGDWLLDPTDITISASGNINGSTVTVSPDTIETSLASNNVIVQSTGTLTVNAPISAPAATGDLSLIAAGDVNVRADIDLGKGLLLKAGSHVKVYKNTDITTHGDITLWADSDASGAGSIVLGFISGEDNPAGPVSLKSNGGNITLSGGANLATGYAKAPINQSEDLIYPTTTPNTGVGIFGASIDATGASGQGGNILIRGSGSTSNASTRAVFIWLGSELKTNGDGNIEVVGDGSGITSSSAPWGVLLSFSNFQTERGDIVINGRVSSNTGQPDGRPLFIRDTQIVSTHGGNITLMDRTRGADGRYAGTRFLNDVELNSGGTISVLADAIVFEGGTGPVWFKNGPVFLNPYTDASFTSALTLFSIKTDTAKRLTVGNKDGQINTANVTVNASTPITVSGPIALYGGNLTLNSPVTAVNDRITLKGTGAVSSGANGYVVANELLLLGGNVTLTHALNDVASLAANGVGTLTYWDRNALGLTTVDTTTGISTTGAIDIQTLTQDLTVAGNITTSAGGATAVLLNAGRSVAAGTGPGGNIVLVDAPTLTATGSGAALKVYTGELTAAGNPNAWAAQAEGRFRYNADETTNFSLAPWTNLGTGRHVIYRQRPTATVGDRTITYGDSLSGLSVASGLVNGDVSTISVNAGATDYSSSGNLKVGSNYSFLTNLSGLGYLVTGSGLITVDRKDLMIAAGTAQNKTYDATRVASVTGSTVSPLLSDAITLSAANATFADKNAADNKAVTTAFTISGLDANNYNLIQQTGLAANISRADLQVTGGTAQDKIHDGTQTATVTGSSIIPLLDDVVILSAAIASFNDKIVGSGKPVTTNFTISGHDANNYNLIQQTGLTANISQPTTDFVSDLTKVGKTIGYGNFSLAPLALSPSARVSSQGVKVVLVRLPQIKEAGVVNVFIPSEIAKSSVSLAFALPDDLLKSITSAVNVEAKLANGGAIPAWLRFDGNNGRFVISEVNNITFPLELSILIDSNQVMVNIAMQ